jgi:hypothetical protein
MFLLKFIFFQIVKIYMFLKNLLTLRDYTIMRTTIDYMVDTDGDDGDEKLNPFWKKESKYWYGDDFEWCNAIVPGNDLSIIKPVPSFVKNIIVRKKYHYDGKEYTCITKDVDMKWPPAEPEPCFRLPIQSVILFDDKDKPVKDITLKIKKYMGPHGDFHGVEDVLMKELLYFTEYSSIKVVNILNSCKDLKPESNLLELV